MITTVLKDKIAASLAVEKIEQKSKRGLHKTAYSTTAYVNKGLDSIGDKYFR